MRESLPGDPTEAGPDNRMQAIAAKDWHDLMCYAKEEIQFAVNRHGYRTREDRSMLREVIARAQCLLTDADAILKGMEVNRAR